MLPNGVFPDDLEPNAHGLVALGGELSVPILLEAYSKGIFPWTGEHPIPWYSPDPRLILEPSAFRASRSLRKLARSDRFEVRFDTDFEGVVRACANMPRPGQDGTWITPNMIRAYTALHRLHLAHSVEVFEDGELVGGLYGVSLGRAFFGESMFSRVSNTSKLALYRLCQWLEARDFHLIDCQQETPHLESLGAVAISRSEYLERLRVALREPTLQHRWVRG